jgi:hypothetical protein
MELVAGLSLEPLAAELTDKLLEVPLHVLPLHVIRQFLHHQAAQVTCKQNIVYVFNIDMNVIIIKCHTNHIVNVYDSTEYMGMRLSLLSFIIFIV